MSYVVDWVLPFLVVLSVLIFVHELGHYLIARACGVMVEVFSIGFGPELFGWTDRVGTRWKVSAVPLGGYVKMYGEETFEGGDAAEPGESVPRRADHLSFRHKRLSQRAAIVAAGPFANILFALVLLLGLFGFVGAPAPLPVVGVVQEGSAAAVADFRAGDLIVKIGDEPITWFEDLRRIVNASPGVELTFHVVRDSAPIEIDATPRPTTQAIDGVEQTVGLLGIRPDLARVGYESLSPTAAVGAAFAQTYALTTQIFDALVSIVRGSRPLDELGGPLRIAQISGQVAQDGLINLLYFMAALSVNLALINFLPIPVLDGGHLLLYAIEAVIHRPLNKRIIEYAFRAGMVFVVCLMLLATWNDLINLRVVDFFRRLVS
ncbi:MAG: RIP metalloprotease RseP [Rhodospirillales bacterium]|nr:RIP metalloprotease RseP [Rhodospirillales bacterium]